MHNAAALKDCLLKAHKLGGPRTVVKLGGPRTVVIPAGYAFSAMPSEHDNLFHVILQIDGAWEASPFYKEWPKV